MRITRTRAAALILIPVALLSAGCARKEISVEETGSVKVEGTNWYRFCDGPNAVMWTKAISSGGDDEIEALVYDHWACAPDWYEKNPIEEPASIDQGPARGDDDGILEDEEQN